MQKLLLAFVLKPYRELPVLPCATGGLAPLRYYSKAIGEEETD